MSDEIHCTTDLDIDAIFRKYKAKVVWEDKGVRVYGDGREEEYDLPEEDRHWTLIDDSGVMSLDGVQEVGDARLAAALFLYLWGEKKVPIAIAIRCAIAHVRTYTVRDIDDDEREQLKKALGGE
jgi:hypothetical protein